MQTPGRPLWLHETKGEYDGEETALVRAGVHPGGSGDLRRRAMAGAGLYLAVKGER